MAKSFNPSGSSNLFGFGPNNDAMDLFTFHPSHSPQGPQHDEANERSMMNSHVHAAPANLVAENEGFTHQIGHPTIIVGQVGLSQRISEIRKATYLASPRVRVHSVIDYFHGQNQPQGEIIVTKVIRTTRFHTPNSSIAELHHHLLQHQHHHCLLAPAGRDIFCHQGRHGPNNKNIKDHNPTNPAQSRNPVPTQFVINSIRIMDYDKVILSPNHPAPDDYIAFDGRTHSLPHRKNGPYTCPKCNGEYPSSQSFAAHMLGHYRNETFEQRRKRLAAKYRNKNVIIVQSPGGKLKVTAVSRRAYRRRSRSGNNGEGTSRDARVEEVQKEEGEGAAAAAAVAAMDVMDMDEVKKEQGQGIHPCGATTNYVVGVKIKEEKM